MKRASPPSRYSCCDAPDILEQRELIAARIELLNGGERRAGLVVLRVAQKELEIALREQREIVVLDVAHGVQKVFAVDDGQARIVVSVGSPG